MSIGGKKKKEEKKKGRDKEVEMMLWKTHQFVLQITQTRPLLTENDHSCSFQVHVE